MARVVILGVFVADTAYRADRPPRMGETILGNSFKLGPGGKGQLQRQNTTYHDLEQKSYDFLQDKRI